MNSDENHAPIEHKGRKIFLCVLITVREHMRGSAIHFLRSLRSLWLNLSGLFFFSTWLSSQPVQGRDVIAHAAFHIVGGLVADASRRRGNVEDAIALFAAP
jgi:hypothetical protein